MSIVKNPFEDTLVYEQDLPLKWTAFDPQANEQALINLNRDNEVLLHVLLGQADGNREPDDNRHETNLELQRLDAKINLLLHWVGQWLATTQGVPESRPVRLTERGIEVGVPFAINVGETLLLELYLNAHFPQPVKLPCEVYSVDHSTAGTQMVACFTGLTMEVHDLIEKLIFRHHRRLVALHRKQDLG